MKRVVVDIVLLSFVTAACCASFISPAIALLCPALPICLLRHSFELSLSHVTILFPKESPFFLSLALIIWRVCVIIVCNRLVLKSLHCGGFHVSSASMFRLQMGWLSRTLVGKAGGSSGGPGAGWLRRRRRSGGESC